MLLKQVDRKRGNINYQGLKKYTLALALSIGFVVAPGLSSLSAVQAQDWRYGQDRRDDRLERERERQRREEWQRQQRQDNGRDWGWNQGRDRNRSYGNNGSYGTNNGRYNNGEVQKGYRDGLDRGQKDAKTNRTPTPSNSQHYREGNAAYREGFARGYAEGYRQFARGRY